MVNSFISNVSCTESAVLASHALRTRVSFIQGSQRQHLIVDASYTTSNEVD